MTDRPTEPPRPGHRWSRTDFGGGMWVQERIPQRKTQTPAQILKAEGRKALSLWKQRTGISAYYIPYFVGHVYVGEGRVKRKYPIGKNGAADSFIAILGTVLAAEAKANNDVLSDKQKEFRRRWTKTGCPFVEYRTPQQLVAALDRIAAERRR